MIEFRRQNKEYPFVTPGESISEKDTIEVFIFIPTQHNYKISFISCHGDLFLCVFSLLLQLCLVLSVQNLLTVTVHLQAHDFALRGTDSDAHCGTVGLLALHSLDVEDPFLTVHCNHFT